MANMGEGEQSKASKEGVERSGSGSWCCLLSAEAGKEASLGDCTWRPLVIPSKITHVCGCECKQISQALPDRRDGEQKSKGKIPQLAEKK